jgi:outer membrane protein assembly factor BamB
MGLVMILGGLMAMVATADPDNAEWPMFRGEPTFAGVRDEPLPSHFSLLWKFNAQRGIIGSVAVKSNTVYVATVGRQVYALNLNDGKEHWQSELTGPVEATPLVVDGRVYVGSVDGVRHALDTADGTEKWAFKAGGKIAGGANYYRAKNRTAPLILFGSYDNKLYAVDGASGEKVWDLETTNYINGAPAVVGNRVIFGGCDGQVRVLDAQTGKVEETIDGGAYIAGSVAAVDNKAYYGHYEFEVVALDLQEKKRLWTYSDRQKPFFSTPAVTADRVVIGGRDRRVHCLDRATGKLVWAFTTKDEVDSSPVVCQDKVVVGSKDGRLYVLNLADGAIVWVYDAGGGIVASPAVVNSRIVVGDTNGILYVFGDPKNP